MSFIMSQKQPPRSQLKRQLYRLIVAREDINAAQKACELFIKSVVSLDDELCYPLCCAVVICYARPFTPNKTLGALPDKWNKFLNPLHQRKHEELLKARHAFIAHSDMSIRKVQIVPPGVIMESDGKEIKSGEFGSRTRYYLLPIKGFPLIHELILDLHSRIIAEIGGLMLKLYGDMELPQKAFDLKIDEGL